MQNSVVMFTFFRSRPQISYVGKFGPNNQNCQFNLEIWYLTNLNMQNSMVMFTFSVKMEIPFSCKYGVKNQNCQFILKFGTKTNSNMWNSMVVWNFSVFDQKYPFWANFVQKI